MFSTEFYPTPIDIIGKMLSPYSREDLLNKTILEPSAGKGDILDYIHNYGSGYHSLKKLFCIEQNIELQSILKAKKFKIIGSDFLEYEKDIDFNLIIMNPPFSNGDEHFLKAWNIMENGDIVCLLNAETINNPYSGKRKLITKIIFDNNGTIENLGDCFKNAERKTGVNVVLIRVSKITNKESFEFDLKDKEKVSFTEELLQNELATRDMLQNIIDDYARAKDFFSKGLAYIEKSNQIASSIADNYECDTYKIISESGNMADKNLNFIEQIKFGIWNKIIKELKIEKYMTSKLRSDFSSFMREQGNIGITKNNIMEFVNMVFENRGNILENSITEVFDTFTKYYKENREYIDGWKTNDKFKVNRNIILPNWVKYENWYGSNNGFSTNYSYNQSYGDIDKALCYISGRDFNTITRIQDAIEKDFKIRSRYIESTFFEIKYYKKGTVHLKFKDEWLWKEFNMRACNGKNWLPEGEKKTWQESKKDLIKI